MNQLQKSNHRTWIVQAEKVYRTDSDGERYLRPVKAHFFHTWQEAEAFFNHYIKVIERDIAVTCASVASSASVETEVPFVATWRRAYK
jgi:hypothetical protein